MQSKRAKMDFCRACGAATWNAQWCGFAIFADCTPIDTKTEIECFFKRRPTYGVSRWWLGFYLEHRSMFNIFEQYEFILAKHVCGSAQVALEHPSYWAVPQPTEINF